MDSAPDKNFARITLKIKNVVMLKTAKGIKYFNPVLASPLFTSPITRQDIKSVTIMNIIEK